MFSTESESTPMSSTTAPASTLEGKQVRLRLTTDSDVARLHQMLSHPDVSKWWGIFDRNRVQTEMIDPDDETVIYSIELAGEVIGLIQYYEETDPDYRHAGIDLFLDPAYHGRGLGADAVRTVARHLFDDRGHHRLIIDPAASNTRAIRSYERVGFRPVGVMRCYERNSDGVWRDGLLMDMLKEELT
jgi:aminoglycoside 6'-N-acetyltransferase